LFYNSGMYDIQIAVAKTNKYASRESGDTVEVVERPQGGFSVILADGQGSGQAAKSLSHLVTTKVVGLIKDGVRDGVAARAVSDYLYAYRGGKVSATLTILSVDLATQTLVLLSNSHCPVLLSISGGEVALVPETPANPIGIYAATRPMMSEVPIQENVWAIAYSDGLMAAGRRDGRPIDLPALVASCLHEGAASAREVVDYLLARALELDANRPSDDMTVAVVAILPLPDPEENKVVPLVRRMEVRVPVA
jgi:serine phosphatase RsbU (regulator of sigma subunit)